MIGGQALGIGSLEYNYQFKPGWRAAIFADAGNAYDEKFSNPTKYGVGLGVRWASPVGPIRMMLVQVLVKIVFLFAYTPLLDHLCNDNELLLE